MLYRILCIKNKQLYFSNSLTLITNLDRYYESSPFLSEQTTHLGIDVKPSLFLTSFNVFFHVSSFWILSSPASGFKKMLKVVYEHWDCQKSKEKNPEKSPLKSDSGCGNGLSTNVSLNCSSSWGRNCSALDLCVKHSSSRAIYFNSVSLF